MKKFRLSTPAERIAGISFTAVMIICFGVLLYALRGNTGLLIASGLGVLLITVILCIYVVSVLKAACIINAETKIMEVQGLSNYTVDLSNAVLLQTLPRKSAQTTIRVLVFSDADEQIVATVPTMFTHKQGILADPMAKEMAEALGIAFKQNVPEWEYDKEKFKEHQKEEAAREKAEAKERRQKRMERRIQKYKKGK